jgi:hypothetical protein
VAALTSPGQLGAAAAAAAAAADAVTAKNMMPENTWRLKSRRQNLVSAALHCRVFSDAETWRSTITLSLRAVYMRATCRPESSRFIIVIIIIAAEALFIRVRSLCYRLYCCKTVFVKDVH